jgi:lysyl-tRNA synthetase class 2
MVEQQEKQIQEKIVTDADGKETKLYLDEESGEFVSKNELKTRKKLREKEAAKIAKDAKKAEEAEKKAESQGTK